MFELAAEVLMGPPLGVHAQVHLAGLRGAEQLR